MSNKLFTPVTFENITLKNRLVMSPMCQYSAIDGRATDWHLVHYGSRAVGNIGLIMLEATAVTPEGRISPYDLGIWANAHIEPLKKIVDFVKENGSKIGIQLAHAGRKASCDLPWKGGSLLTSKEGGWQPISVGNVPYHKENPNPREITLDEIAEITEAFGLAAVKAVEAGFDIIEIHAAHGYLLHEFLSPLTNNRTDEYGGSPEKRQRFLLEIIDKVKKYTHNKVPVFVRISAEDWIEGGNHIEQNVQLSLKLKEVGVSLIDCSSGALAPQQDIPVEKGYQLPFAETIKKEVGIPTGAVGLITSLEEAEKILQEDKADLIFMGRELLRNPYIGLRSEKKQEKEEWPKQYYRAQPKS